MNKPPAKKDSNADFGAVARQPGDGNEVEAAQVAVDSLVLLFNRCLRLGYADNKASIDGLVSAIHQREISIRAQVDFDCDGILSFQFLEIANGLDLSAGEYCTGKPKNPKAEEFS